MSSSRIPDDQASILSDYIIRNLSKIRGLARKFVWPNFGVIDNHDAEDLAQETVLRVLQISDRKQLRFDSDDQFLRWLSEVLRNVGKEFRAKKFLKTDHWRKSKSRPSQSDADSPEEPSSQDQEREIILQEIIDKLEQRFDDFKISIFLALKQGHTASEIARNCGLTQARISQINKEIASYIFTQLSVRNKERR